MSSAPSLLPSWRAGTTRDRILSFLDAAESVPVEHRVACFDNDGTLWCERPTYVQFDFFLDALRRRHAADPSLQDRPEFAALLDGDGGTLGDLGLARVAMALLSLFEGLSPEEYTTEVRDFIDRGTNAALGRPLRTMVYQPMLELIDELRRRDFTVTIVSGGGCDFVRAVSQDFYGVPPEAVVGTLLAYTYARDDEGRPTLRRSGHLVAGANEGEAKVSAIQSQLGRRPILAAGNTGGDREMLEYTTASRGPSLALLVDHDDAEREFCYLGSAESLADPEPITDVAKRQGWTVASMRDDWSQIFRASEHTPNNC